MGEVVPPFCSGLEQKPSPDSLLPAVRLTPELTLADAGRARENSTFANRR